MVAQVKPISESRSTPIKLLDLLTNRYHVGVIRESSDGAMHVELAACSNFQAGQRVRFVVADDHAVVCRTKMQRACITQVSPHLADRMNVRIAVLPETAVA